MSGYVVRWWSWYFTPYIYWPSYVYGERFSGIELNFPTQQSRIGRCFLYERLKREMRMYAWTYPAILQVVQDQYHTHSLVLIIDDHVVAKVDPYVGPLWSWQLRYCCPLTIVFLYAETL